MALFNDLRVAASKLTDSSKTEDALKGFAKDVPNSYSLQDLEQEIIAASAGQDSRLTTLTLLACLRQDSKLKAAPEDAGAAQRLASFVAKAMAPIDESNDDPEEDGQGYFTRISERSRHAAAAGLEAIGLLVSRAPAKLDDQALLTLTAFADESAAWTTTEVSEMAVDLLHKQIPDESRARFIVETVLGGYLRPLFSRSRPATVTASGRKAEYIDRERESGLPDDSRKTKPWKYEDLRAISAFSWAVEDADEQLITQHWPLFIPVLLTLVDDSNTRIRAHGLEILASFLGKFPVKKLRETGLASVFEQAIFPTLLYLPSITPVDESLQLLGPAYDALFALTTRLSTDTDTKEKDQLLDKVLREGIFTAYFHASDHVRIVELLFRQTAFILAIMGIKSVKHLKDLVPMVSAVMTDPFAMTHPATLLSAITVLQAIISNAWPRISDGPWKDEILKALVLAWLNLRDGVSKSTESDRVASELIKTTTLLSAVTKTAHSSLPSQAALLVSEEPALAPLFAGSS